jgi:urea transport system substrate-binding protein
MGGRRAVFVAILAGLGVGAACGNQAPPEPTSKPRLVPFDAPSPAQAREPASPELGAREPVPVGIVHSLTGALARYESPLKDMALMTIDELNAEGGVLGRPLAPVVVDPASNWPLFAEKARELIEMEHARVLFGGYTSVSRKSMLPVLEELRSLLFYPVEYEGERPSPNVAYLGAVPNQSISVVVDYLADAPGPKPKRWVVIGTDYILSRTYAKVVTRQLVARGLKADDVVSMFFPFGHEDFLEPVQRLQQISHGQPTVLISLLVGESADQLQRELVRQRVPQQTVQTVSFGIDERQLAEQSPSLFQGTLVASSYFNMLDNPVNAAFTKRWASYVREHGLPSAEANLNAELEATYLAIRLWKKAAESAKSVEPVPVLAALGGQSMLAPSGFTVSVDPATHHVGKPYFIGRVGADGRVSLIFRTPSVGTPIARNFYEDP